MSIKLEYKNIEGQSLNILKVGSVANADFIFFADGRKYNLSLLGIIDIVDISHLIEATEFGIERHPEKESEFLLTLFHEYGVDLSIKNYAINS